MKILRNLSVILIAFVLAGCSVKIEPLPEEKDSWQPKNHFDYEEIGQLVMYADVCYRYLSVPKNRDLVRKIKDEMQGKPINSTAFLEYEAGVKTIERKYNAVDGLTGNSRKWCLRYGRAIEAIGKQLSVSP